MKARNRTFAIVLLFDPYSDFLSESGAGKVWPGIKPIADKVGLIGNLPSTNHVAELDAVRSQERAADQIR